MKRIMVTGINGFVGKHLAYELSRQKTSIVGVGRETQPHNEIADLLDNYVACDLANKESVGSLSFDGVDAVISLAGLARPAESFKNPELYKSINVAVLSNICQQLVNKKLSPRVIAISTGTVYATDQAMPLTENSRLAKDGSPYAISKILMEEAARTAQSQGLDCVIVRPFNHIGPGQEPGLLVPDLYEQILKAKQTDGVMKVGNLKTKRDYTDVRDVVRAYVRLAVTENLTHDTYNVCSGKSVSGETVLHTLLGAMDLTKSVSVEVDPARIRPTDLPDLYGSYDWLHQDTGWQPEIPFEQTIRDFVKSSN